MSQTSLLICILFALAAVQQTVSLKVSVYYESLCPDSIRFITRQLYPTYGILDFDVEFVPYGKADHNTDPWSIRCQHGVNECLGNAVQACLLERHENTTEQVELVNCIMGSSYPPTAGQKCADSFDLSYDGVAECSTGDEGRSLLARNGDVTHGLDPKLSFVPTVIINDEYSQANQDLALTNLAQAICNVDPSVTGCSKRSKIYPSWRKP